MRARGRLWLTWYASGPYGWAAFNVLLAVVSLGGEGEGKGVVDVVCLWTTFNVLFCISFAAAERLGTPDASRLCSTASPSAQSFQRSPPFHISTTPITRNYFQFEKLNINNLELLAGRK